MLTTSSSGVTIFGSGSGPGANESQRGRGRGRGLGYYQGRGRGGFDNPARPTYSGQFSQDRQAHWGLPTQTTLSGPSYFGSNSVNTASFKPVPFVKAISTEEETSKVSEALALLTQSLANVNASQNAARIQSPPTLDTRGDSSGPRSLNASMVDIINDGEIKDRNVIVPFFIDEWYNDKEASEIRALAASSHSEFPLVINYDNGPSLPYRASRSSNVLRTRLHKGQRKLYLGVKNFLTRCLARVDAKTTIVYAGAAPCTNLPLLLGEFPNTIWILYDPAPFRIALTKQDEKRVTLHNELFTDDIAKSWRGLCDLFISDIRAGGVDPDDEELSTATTASTSSSGFEQQVKLDMDAQARWVKLTGARMAMLKMRLPYASGKTLYLSGQLHIQAFAPKASTESRLFTDGTSTFDYSNDKYNDWFYYHNSIRREWAYYAHDEEAPGLCHCYDCMLELDIHAQYRRKQGELDDVTLDPVLSRDFDKVTRFLQIDMLEGGHAYKPNVPMWLKRRELVEMNPTSRDPRWSERHSIVPSSVASLVFERKQKHKAVQKGPIGTERAQRMMQQQGWVPGSGLGPDLAGRSEPVTTTNRYGSRAGLGLGSSTSFLELLPPTLPPPSLEADITEITLPAYSTRQWSLSIQVNEVDMQKLAKQLAASLETLRKIATPRVISEWAGQVSTTDYFNLESKAKAYDIDEEYEDPSIAHEKAINTDAQHDPNEVLIDMDLYKKLCLLKNEFAKYDPRRFTHARNLANPWEYTREDGGTFVNRCGMKLANIDYMVNRKITTANLADDKLADGTNRGNLYVGDMCAAPGGFAAFLLAEKKWRARIMAISLKTRGRDYRIPTFASSSEDLDPRQARQQQSSFKPISPMETFTTYFGPDRNSDGNVLDSNILNGWIQHLIDNTPDKRGVDVLQADGGLSVEGKENEQEYYTSKLILAECIAAIQATRAGGNALIKWFDMVTPYSATLLWIMAHVFTKVQVLKPEESRPANSECYIWFENKRPPSIHLTTIIDVLLSYYRNKDVCFDTRSNLPRIQLLSLSIPSFAFINKLKEINTVLGQHQWFFCKEILSLLSRPGPLPNVHDVDYHLFISKPMGQTLGQFGEFYQTNAIEISDILRQRWSDGRPVTATIESKQAMYAKSVSPTSKSSRMAMETSEESDIQRQKFSTKINNAAIQYKSIIPYSLLFSAGKVSEYSSLKPWELPEHKQVLDSLNGPIRSIIDATGHVGMDAILLYNVFPEAKVTVVEKERNVYEILKENLDIVTRLSQKKPRLASVYGNGVDVLLSSNESYDIIYFDPPWGGPNYKEEKETALVLVDNNGKLYDMFDLVGRLFTLKRATKYIILKAPYNYDSTNKFRQNRQWNVVVKEIHKTLKDGTTLPRILYQLLIITEKPQEQTTLIIRRGGPRINMLFDDDELRFARHESCQEYHQEGTFIWNWPLETQNIANAVQGISDVIKDLFCHPAWFNIRFSKTETIGLGEEFVLLTKSGGGVIQQARRLINETKAAKSTSFIYPLSTSVYIRESDASSNGSMDTTGDDDELDKDPSSTSRSIVTPRSTTIPLVQTRLLLGLPAILVCLCRYQVLYVYDIQDKQWSWLEIRTKFDTDGNAYDTPQRHINDKLVKVDPKLTSKLPSDMWRIPPGTVLSGIYMTNVVSDSRFYVLDVSQLPDTTFSMPNTTSTASHKPDDDREFEVKQHQQYISCKDRQAVLVDFMATTTEPMLQYRRPLDPQEIATAKFSMPTDLILVTDVGWHMIRMTFA